MSNQQAFNDPEVVAKYTTYNTLTPPELAFLDIIKSKGVVNLLDIGVGTGRTTMHFAPICEKYTGIDYAANMIDVCKNQFAYGNSSFFQMDARDLSAFENNTFDTVLFSYNGIDYVSHQDRLLILNEIKRVLKPGGRFFFSTHNIYGLRQLYKLHFSYTNHPYYLIKNVLLEFLFRFKIIVKNKPLSYYLSKDYCFVNDGALNFRLQTYYTKPSYQIEQLRTLDFNNLKIYSLSSGREILPETNPEDAWIYYYCEK